MGGVDSSQSLRLGKLGNFRLLHSYTIRMGVVAESFFYWTVGNVVDLSDGWGITVDFPNKPSAFLFGNDFLK